MKVNVFTQVHKTTQKRFGLRDNALLSINVVACSTSDTVSIGMGDRLQAYEPFISVCNQPPGQLSLAMSPWVGAVGTGESWGSKRAHFQCKLVSGWG